MDTETRESIDKILKTQEKIIKILENIAPRIKNLEEFAWKGIAEKKNDYIPKGYIPSQLPRPKGRGMNREVHGKS